MKTITVLACAWLAAAGCASEFSGDVRVTSPELVTLSPGIQVVSDADEPVFYADGYYWLYRDNVWYRSDSYRSGFARMDMSFVPGELREIRQPQVYAHYRRHAARVYARGPQIEQREQPRPQPQERIQEPRQPEPQQAPTEPQPSSPEQKPPVANPMPSQNNSIPDKE